MIREPRLGLLLSPALHLAAPAQLWLDFVPSTGEPSLVRRNRDLQCIRGFLDGIGEFAH